MEYVGIDLHKKEKSQQGGDTMKSVGSAVE
jgi:hypothetical protein